MTPTERAQIAARARWSKPNPKMPPPRKADQSKISARFAGESKYIGSDCKRNHGGTRYTRSGQCVECVAEYKLDRILK